MKTLHLCNRVPFPRHDGGAIGIYDIINHLAQQGAAVTVLAINTPKHYQDPASLPSFARFISVAVDTDLSYIRAVVNLFSRRPYNFERFYAPAFAARLEELLKAETFDVVQVEGSQMAWYLPLIRQYSQAPVVLRAHNVEYTIWERLARHERSWLKKRYLSQLARRVKRFEQQYLPRFDAIAAITDEDQDRIRALGVQAPIKVIPAGVDLPALPPDCLAKPKPQTLFMLGALNWRPNLEGISWFLQEVWPQIHREFPEMECHLAGASPPAWLERLQVPGLFIHGFVPDAADFRQAYELMLVPLLSGGGMRIKLLEGMAEGKAILTTPVGAEGLPAVPGRDLLIGQTAKDWLTYLRQYGQGRLNLAALGKSARILAVSRFDNTRVIPQYLQLYRELQNLKG